MALVNIASGKLYESPTWWESGGESQFAQLCHSFLPSHTEVHSLAGQLTDNSLNSQLNPPTPAPNQNTQWQTNSVNQSYIAATAVTMCVFNLYEVAARASKAAT